MKVKKILLNISIILLLMFIGSCSSDSGKVEAPVAKKGEIHLINWDFIKNGNIKLNGEWEFYWGKLLTEKDFNDSKKVPSMTGYINLPGTWNDYKVDGEKIKSEGFATYRLKVKLGNKKNLMGIKIDDIATAYKLIINGELICKNGVVGENSERSKPQYLPGVYLIDKNENLDIILQVSNFHHRLGGPWNPILIGAENKIREARTFQVGKELFLIGILLIMGLYHLGLYVLRHKNRSTLYFSIFCLAIALRTLLVGQRFIIFLYPEMNWEFASKLEYLTFFFGAPFFSLFIYSLFPKDYSKKVLNIFLILLVLFSAVTFVTPTLIYSKIMQAYQIVTLISAIYATVVMIMATNRKRDGAAIFLFGWSFLFVTIINDLLYESHYIYTGSFVSIGLFVFIFSQAFLLSRLFSTAFDTIEDLSDELSNVNIAYSKFVPMQFLKFLKKDSIVDVKLGDHVQKEMTVLFTDIRGFTTISETMTPKENFDFLNSFLNRFGPIIRDHNGFIDKYIGDAIMALFPYSMDDAIMAGIDMRMKLFKYNYHRIKSGYKPIDFGVGIHTGLLMMGTIGESERMEGTVIADAVNLTSRLEGLTKIYGADIIVTGNAMAKLESPDKYNYRFIGNVIVKGKKEEIALYEICDGDLQNIVSMKMSSKNNFKEGLDLYSKKEFNTAINSFAEILKENPEDKVADFYLQKSKEYLNVDVNENWNGALCMDSK